MKPTLDFKRLFDAVAAGFFLVLAAVPAVLTAILVALFLGRPVLFRQVRPGLRGRPFTLVKFRTMRDAVDGRGRPLPDSERLTRLGRLLRRLSLDEIPQLWNVLWGDMSLVGPRPLLMEYWELYTPEQRRRHDVRPGITGWAQINGRNAIDWDERFRLDVWYVDHRSWRLDLLILWQTFGKVFRSEGISAPGQATMPPFTGPRKAAQFQSTGIAPRNSPNMATYDKNAMTKTSMGLYLLGAGGHAKVVADAARLSDCGPITGIFDDAPACRGQIIGGMPVLGGREELLKHRHSSGVSRAVVAIGDNSKRREVCEWLLSNGFELAVVVHPQACIAEDAEIGPGTVVLAKAVVSPAAQIGRGVIVNTGAIVEHDALVGDYSHLAPGSVVCGGVRIETEVLLGAGSTVISGKAVHTGARVGSQAAVVDDVAAFSTVIGVPARARIASSPPAPATSTAATAAAAEWSPWPHFADDELEAAAAVLRSGKVNYWTGEECRRFEEEFAAAVGCKHAIALANGTLALELALYAIDLRPGDEVIVTPRTFIASASCIVMRGGKPVFADVDANSQNITAESIARVATPRTRAIIAVHLAGWPCDMDPIMQFSRARGIKVVEDCAQAQGGRYRGRPIGSLGDLAAFSFCQDKITTTGGEGGMLTLNDSDLWSRAWSFRDHGKSFDAVYHRKHEPGFRWLHESFGSNYRLTEVQGAIGRRQLQKLPRWIAMRRAHAERLREHFADLRALRIPRPPSDVEHAYYKFYLFVEQGELRDGWSRDRLLNEINAAGVPCFTGTCGEIYLEKAFADFNQARLAEAHRLGETSLMLQVHPTLRPDEIDRVGKTVRAVVERATRPSALRKSA